MQLFLSHSAEDARIASALKRLIEQCSLGRATVWFSSDTSPEGGVTPGSPWFDQLVERISTSVVFLALVTPLSAKNPWLHYEAGCAATNKIPVFPIVAGLSITDVRQPLSLYNVQNVAQPDGLKNFLMRLFLAHGIPHDEAMLETPIQRTIREITAALDAMKMPETAGSDETDRVLRLIDRRFIDLIERLPASSVIAAPADQDQRPLTFNVSAIVTKKGKTIDRVSLDVTDTDTLQDVANALYFKIDKYVEPYKYLEQWIVRDNTYGVSLVMRDFFLYVKAVTFIRPGHEYEIILLSKPYDASKGDHQSLS